MVYMILVLTFPALPLFTSTLYPTTLLTCISTGFYMCHQSGPISILLIVSLGWLLQSTSQIMSTSSHVFMQLFFFCVSTPVLLPLHVDIILCNKSLTIVLNQCIAASGGVYYIWFYHIVSACVYNVLLVLFLSLCINSWRSFQYTWNSSSSLFLSANLPGVI